MNNRLFFDSMVYDLELMGIKLVVANIDDRSFKGSFISYKRGYVEKVREYLSTWTGFEIHELKNGKGTRFIISDKSKITIIDFTVGQW